MLTAVVPRILYENSIPYYKRHFRHIKPFLILLTGVHVCLPRCSSGTSTSELGTIKKNDHLNNGNQAKNS